MRTRVKETPTFSMQRKSLEFLKSDRLIFELFRANHRKIHLAQNNALTVNA